MERRTTEPLKPGPRGPVAPANLERSGGFVRWWVCAEWRAPGSCAVPDSPDRTSMSLPLLAARCLVSVLSAAHWLPMSAHGPPTGHGPGPSWVHPSHGHRLGLKGRLGEAPPGGVPGYCTGAKEDLMEHDRAKNPPVLFLLLHRHHVRDSRPFRRRPPDQRHQNNHHLSRSSSGGREARRGLEIPLMRGSRVGRGGAPGPQYAPTRATWDLSKRGSCQPHQAHENECKENAKRRSKQRRAAGSGQRGQRTGHIPSYACASAGRQMRQ